ncbi:MAG: hypothetical protein HY506_01325 [Candidatus Yanofskybacteria bacterium]|nr:hypothetical protein [Candidatus Yanofskybacteria bacterium]
MLSLALTFLLFTTIIIPSPLVLILVISFLIAWFHLALSWLPILVYLAIALWTLIFKFFCRVQVPVPWPWREGLALVAGLLIGWLARPNPLGAFKLAYIQIIQLFIEKYHGTPLQFGTEMLRFSWDTFYYQLWPFGLLFLTAVVFWLTRLFSRKQPLNQSTIIRQLSSLTLSLLFLYLTLFVAIRSLEVFTVFAVTFVAVTAREFFKTDNRYLKILAIIFILIQVWNTMPMFNFYLSRAHDPNLFKDSATWLREHSKPDSIVFNPYWDRFGQLFFWNQQNYYINGMDPIFEYAYDPKLYWKTHFYATDVASEFTCGAVACTKEEVEPTDKVLRDDFRAAYVFLDKERGHNFYDYLNNNSTYKKTFETEKEVIFQIKPK